MPTDDLSQPGQNPSQSVVFDCVSRVGLTRRRKSPSSFREVSGEVESHDDQPGTAVVVSTVWRILVGGGTSGGVYDGGEWAGVFPGEEYPTDASLDRFLMRRAKVDRNHAEIVEALRSVGWLVKSCAQLGRGFPDLVIARGHDVRLVEVKTPKGKLTVDQQQFIVRDGWPVRIIRTVDEALAL